MLERCLKSVPVPLPHSLPTPLTIWHPLLTSDCPPWLWPPASPAIAPPAWTTATASHLVSFLHFTSSGPFTEEQAELFLKMQFQLLSHPFSTFLISCRVNPNPAARLPQTLATQCLHSLPTCLPLPVHECCTFVPTTLSVGTINRHSHFSPPQPLGKSPPPPSKCQFCEELPTPKAIFSPPLEGSPVMALITLYINFCLHVSLRHKTEQLEGKTMSCFCNPSNRLRVFKCLLKKS